MLNLCIHLGLKETIPFVNEAPIDQQKSDTTASVSKASAKDKGGAAPKGKPIQVETPESQKTLTVFLLYEGSGEWFDLSKKPIERADFSFGGAEDTVHGYFVTSMCTGCGLCESLCKFDAIELVKAGDR